MRRLFLSLGRVNELEGLANQNQALIQENQGLIKENRGIIKQNQLLLKENRQLKDKLFTYENPKNSFVQSTYNTAKIAV